jgi:integrase
MDKPARSPLARSFERHMRAENRSERTIATYLFGLRQAETFLRERPDRGRCADERERAAFRPTTLEAATRADLEAFMADVLARGRAPSTAATYYKVLRVLYVWLVEEQEIQTDPMARMKPPTVPAKPVPIVPADGLKRLFAACAGAGFEARRDTALVMLLLDTGARRAEMVGLKLTDVDLDLDVLLVLGKGRRERAAVWPQGRRRPGPLPSRPGAPQGRRAALAMAWTAGPADPMGPGADAAAPRRASRPARPAPAPAAPHLRPPVAGGRRRGDRPDAPGRLEVPRHAATLRRLSRGRPGPRGPSTPFSW